jgi:hypothetical protein
VLPKVAQRRDLIADILNLFCLLNPSPPPVERDGIFDETS